MLLMDHTILKSEYQALKQQNSDLAVYKAKFEQLQKDIQNNAISASGDGKQLLVQFKEENEKQQEVIELLRNELQLKQKENDVYRTFSKRTGDNSSA